MIFNDEIKNELLDTRKGCDVDHEGHAQAVLLMYPDKFRYIPTHGWMFYNGKCWAGKLADQAVEQAVTNVLQRRRELFAGSERMNEAKMCMSWRSTIVNTKAQLGKCSGVVASIDEFNNSKDHVNVQNGVLDLRTGKLEEHTPKQLYTYCLDVAYENNPEGWGEWCDFLEATGNGGEMMSYLQMALGYTLTGHTREEVLFYLYGQRRTGKGTFTETITKMLRGLAAGVDMDIFSKGGRDTNNFHLAPLVGMRYVTASESDRRGISPTIVKKLTGGDAVYCSNKGKPHFYYYPSYKIWLTSNHPANMDVEDDAAWGRLRVIVFNNSFYGNEDKGLKERLSSQKYLNGIFWWCVQGAISWYNTRSVGLPLPKQVEETTQAHRDELDSITQFIDAQCTINLDDVDENGNPNLHTAGKRLYQSYKAWCEEEGYIAYGRKRFTTNLAARGIVSKPKWDSTAGKSVRGYFGIGFVGDSDDEPTEIKEILL